jgi:nickel/cobalt exporter
MDAALNLFYFPTALALGALHALEPGHAKALTAAYLIGIKGTKRDSIILGLSVATTHSIVVIGISAIALWLGNEAFAGDAIKWLEYSSGIIAILIGLWMLQRRIFGLKQHTHDHSHEHEHEHHHEHNHEHLDDIAHARAHEKALPQYVRHGERPGLLQIISFGAAGGMIPCPASITVMLLALSTGKAALGFFTVMGFSIGLAFTLVSLGLLVVTGINKLNDQEKLTSFTKKAPIISASLVVLSGILALLIALKNNHQF